MICRNCREPKAARGCTDEECRHPLVAICGLTYRRLADGIVAIVSQVPVGERVTRLGRNSIEVNSSVSEDGTIVLREVDVEHGGVNIRRSPELHHEPDLATFRSRWERVERGWVKVVESEEG